MAFHSASPMLGMRYDLTLLVAMVPVGAEVAVKQFKINLLQQCSFMLYD